MHIPLGAAVFVVVGPAAVDRRVVVLSGARESIAPLAEGVDEA